MFAKSLLLFYLAGSALGGVYITSPTAASTFTGGQQATINWQDDGTTPLLSQFGPSTIAIYIGNALQQTPLQTISNNTDVSKTSAIQFTADPTIGPNNKNYFVRIQSLSFMDPKMPQYNAMAFSAKFTMAGMSGSFNAAEQAQINGQSTAPLTGPTAASSGNSTAVSSTASATTTTGSKASATAASNAAVGLGRGPIGLLMAAIVGATLF
ncbi:hypothetical protein APHAL10511_007943 [Amanita phalloides]|nr:hypothetical protein APHAL10511_007943 [Amanita phalloides]